MNPAIVRDPHTSRSTASLPRGVEREVARNARGDRQLATTQADGFLRWPGTTWFARVG